MHRSSSVSQRPYTTIEKIGTDTPSASQKKNTRCPARPKTSTFHQPYQYGRQTGHRDHDLMQNVEHQRTPRVLK